MKQLSLAALLLAAGLAIAGCATERYAYYERGPRHEPDTLATMSKQDIIALSQAKVADDVIVTQIRASSSYFQLSTQDIIDLTSAGVSKAVIQEMIKTGQEAPPSSGYAYYYPPYYWDYAYYPYWYPYWYPSFSLGFSFGHFHNFYGRRAYFPHYGFSSPRGNYGGRGMIRR